MAAASLLLSKHSKSQQMPCSLLAPFLSQSLKCRGWHHPTLSFPTHPLPTFWVTCQKFLIFIFFFCSFQTLSIYDTIFLCCLNCCYLALRGLAWLSSCCGFPYSTQNSYFWWRATWSHLGSTGAWSCTERGKWSKRDSLGHNHRIRSPSLMMCIWGDGWERPSTNTVKNEMNS